MMYLYKFRELYILLRLALGLPIIQGLADGKRVGQPSGGAGWGIVLTWLISCA